MQRERHAGGHHIIAEPGDRRRRAYLGSTHLIAEVGAARQMTAVLLLALLCQSAAGQHRRSQSTDTTCPLLVPRHLQHQTNRPRPSGLVPWSSRNVSKYPVFHLRFAPPGDVSMGWGEVIRASQHPARCNRFLLLEDDSQGSGLGADLRLASTALLIAVAQSRVLLHVPGKQVIYRGLPNISSGKWCDRPPYTWDCLWEPLSHCDPPPPDAVEVTPQKRQRWMDQDPVVRITTSWLLEEGLWHTSRGSIRVAAVNYLLKARPWVVRLSECLMLRSGLQAGNYLNVFIRQSPEKEQELKMKLPSAASYFVLSKAIMDVLKINKVFVQTASPDSLGEFRGLAHFFGMPLSYTENPRSESDVHGGRSQSASVAMWQGVVAAVNMYIGQRAAASLGLFWSQWSGLLHTLIGCDESDVFLYRCSDARRASLVLCVPSSRWSNVTRVFAQVVSGLAAPTKAVVNANRGSQRTCSPLKRWRQPTRE
mmetsp:Transcript_12210/g.26099  ORF Transcript_12210/g.26099 Transcript_12210/m.26099 type:complete len:479 (+) Transcript_12210:76-1512(+)